MYWVTTVGQPKIFISYAHEDDKERTAIVQELKILGRDVWVDRQITAGSEWNEEIQRQLNEADIIVLLVSRHFLSSEFVTTCELPRALERHDDKSAVVIPVLVKRTSWEHLPIFKLNAIPADDKWMTGSEWNNPDEAVTSVAQSINRACTDLMAEREKRLEDERKAERMRLEEQQKAEEEYRREVAEALSDHRISPLERETLEEARARLGISEEVGKKIEAGELQPIEEKRQNIAKYEKSVAIAFENYSPGGPEWHADLNKRRSKLGLTEEDVAGVQERVTARLKEDRKAREEAERKADKERKAKEAPEAKHQPKEEHQAKKAAGAKRKADRKPVFKSKPPTLFSCPATRRMALWSHTKCLFRVTKAGIEFVDHENEKYSFSIPKERLEGASFSEKYGTDLVIALADGSKYEVGLDEAYKEKALAAIKRMLKA